MKSILKNLKKNQVFLENVRCNYPSLDKAQKFNADDENEEGKYTIEVLIPKKDKETIAAIKTYVTNIIQKSDKLKVGQKQAAKKKALDWADAYNVYAILKDGDKQNEKREAEEKEVRVQYKDHMILRLKKKESNGRPLVVDEQATQIPDMSIREEIQSGYWVNVAFSAFAYAYQGNPGVSVSLSGVQKVKEDEVFGQENPFSELAPIEEEDLSENPFDEAV